MSHFFFYSLPVWFILISAQLSAQKKWDGGGNDDQWNNALNWVGDAVPASTDEVLLDNSLIEANYIVKLPGGAMQVSVRRITILPSATRAIELILPPENTEVPALTVAGPGYGLDIGAGGIFRNASGASSGTPVEIADSIKIENGGRYIHHTERAHAANVQVLSAAPGTEQGIMEFDVPDQSSTLSLSGRTFGTLFLRADAVEEGALKYTAAGTMPVRVRGNLEIGPGVACGLNFSDTIFVKGQLIDSGILDMGNTARSVVVAVSGGVFQSPSGIMTESGTGIQQLLLEGPVLQELDLRGRIDQAVAFVFNNAATVLLSPLVLPYRLSLIKGVLTSSSKALLTLGPECIIEADSLDPATFINGPIQKKGLLGQDFLFPVGKSIRQRWLQLKNATGDFTVEYFQSDPGSLSGIVGGGLHHISHLEHWNISANTYAGNAAVKLSFGDPGSGGVTDLADLRVARLLNGVWQNQGNTSVGGNPGADGWVCSFSESGLPTTGHFFTLASASEENTLPISRVLLRTEVKQNVVRLTWTVVSDKKLRLELQRKSPDTPFETIAADVNDNSFDCAQTDVPAWFRIKAIGPDGKTVSYSNLVSVKPKTDHNYGITGSTIVSADLDMTITAPNEGRMTMTVYNHLGMPVRSFSVETIRGSVTIAIQVSGLPAGTYYIVGTTPQGRTNLFHFIRI